MTPHDATCRCFPCRAYRSGHSSYGALIRSLAAAEPCRVYAPCGDVFALVDEVDFAWASQWRWSLKWSRGGTKAYMRRVAHVTTAPNERVDGKLIRHRLQQTIWLHREILIRSGQLPPSPLHIIVDHRDGDELNCRRANLRWATHEMNNAPSNRRMTGATIRRRLNGLR